MFGHQDENNEEETNAVDNTGSVVVDGNPVPADDTTTDTPVADASVEEETKPEEETPAEPAEEPSTAPETPEEPATESAPEVTEDAPESTDSTESSSEGSAPADTAPVNEDLMSIKQEALQQLSPLVDHLDQTPEEKFHTTMMMIQAADNQSLIQSAFETAKQITDDKVRAQALLDIINEINYFTQNEANK
jgi:hypothetical protein